MEVFDKIKLVRSLKGWTQEQMADKLEISTYAYAKIERGETDVNFSRLQQIAEVMEIDLLQLLSLDDKTLFNSTGAYITQCQYFDNWHVNSSTEQIEYKHELEKAHLMIEQQQKEMELLKQQIHDLREMIHLLKKPEK
jgi:transcriptional regulator with XRE-family HTH domain